MTLTIDGPNAQEPIVETYSSNSIPTNPQEKTRNLVISKIEQQLGCIFTVPTPGRDTSSGKRPIGKTGPFHQTCSTRMYSDGLPVTMIVKGKYRNPGARFDGEAELSLRYDKETNEDDLKGIRYAILNSGLTKKT